MVEHAFTQLIMGRCEKRESSLWPTRVQRSFTESRIWGGSLWCALELSGNGERVHSGNQWSMSKGVGGSGEHRALALLD